jgi:hypothetical protein
MAVSGAGARTCPILSAATTTALTTGLLDGGGLDSVAAVHFVKLVDGEFVGFNVRISHVIPLFLRRDHSLMHGGRREYMARFIGRVLRVTHRTRTLSDSSQDARDQIRTAPNTPVLAEGSLTLGPGDLLSRGIVACDDAGHHHEKGDEGKKRNNGSDGNDAPDLHPFSQGLLKELPKAGSPWPEEQRKLWLDTAASIFKMISKRMVPISSRRFQVERGRQLRRPLVAGGP